MRNQTRLYFLLFTVSLFLLGACSTPVSVPLSAENRNVIKRVQIDKNVAKPAAIYWRGTEQAWGGALFGAMGAAAMANSGATDADRMLAFMNQEHIDISEIVLSEATRQVAALRMVELTDTGKADATLSFSVDMYGFNKTHPFGSNMNPLIRITGKLVKPNNEVVWQESEFVSDLASENDQGQSLDTYRNQPEKLRAALVKASEVAVKRVVSKLP
jgi:hypothetical protein